MNEGASPPDYTSNIGLFRALVGDTDAINVVSGIGQYVWFSDDEIIAFLSLYQENPKSAAARALYTIASSQALLLKKFSADDLHVDGAAIAEALRRQAKDLQDEVAAGNAVVDFFEVSTPGSNATQFWPEGFPLPVGGIGRAVTWSETGGWTVEDGYVVNG